MQASVHAPYMLACTGPYLSQIGSDQRDQIIYGIRRTCRFSLSTQSDPSTQADVHAHYVLVIFETMLGPCWDTVVTTFGGSILPDQLEL